MTRGYMDRHGREGEVGGKLCWVQLSEYLPRKDDKGTEVEGSAPSFPVWCKVGSIGASWAGVHLRAGWMAGVLLLTLVSCRGYSFGEGSCPPAELPPLPPKWLWVSPESRAKSLP